uniref:F-box domain-containing protein n=1 Tax=viral metagenome TaxID=1070528 RepID=A0A6C0C6Y6_9ZZZZ
MTLICICKMFYFDIFSQICKYLNNKDKINLSAISSVTDRFKCKLMFSDFVLEKQIRRLPFCDNFENLYANCTCDKIPRGVKKLEIECFGMCKEDSQMSFLGGNLTELILYQYSYKPITRECFTYKNLRIPKSVTKLITGGRFNQSIENLISDSVTHLALGWDFNQSIKNIIPDSVTHLSIAQYWNHTIQYCIPQSVTHLTLLYGCGSFVSPIPRSIKCLKLETIHGSVHIMLSGKDLVNLNDNMGAVLRKFVPSSINEIIICPRLFIINNKQDSKKMN